MTALVNPDVELLDDSLLTLAAEAARRDAPERLLAPLVLSARRLAPGHGPPGSRRRCRAGRSPCAVHPAAGARTAARAVASVDAAAGRLGGRLRARRRGPRRCAGSDRSTSAIFLYGEDLELGPARRRAGVETWFWPAARVIHHGAHSSTRRSAASRSSCSQRARHDVVQRRSAPRRARLDDASQAVTFASRIVVKRALGRPAARERRQLEALRCDAGSDEPAATARCVRCRRGGRDRGRRDRRDRRRRRCRDRGSLRLDLALDRGRAGDSRAAGVDRRRRDEQFGVNVNRLFNDRTYTPAQIDAQLAALSATGATVARSDALWEATEPARAGRAACTTTTGASTTRSRARSPRTGCAGCRSSTTRRRGRSRSPARTTRHRPRPPTTRRTPPRSPPATAPAGSFWRAHPGLTAAAGPTRTRSGTSPTTRCSGTPARDAAAYAELYLQARDAIDGRRPERARARRRADASRRRSCPRCWRRPRARAASIDGVAIHPYGRRRWRVLAKRPRGAGDARRRWRSSRVPLYVTEFGWTTQPRGSARLRARAAAPRLHRARRSRRSATPTAASRRALLYTWVTPERDPDERARTGTGSAHPHGGSSPDVDARSPPGCGPPPRARNAGRTSCGSESLERYLAQARRERRPSSGSPPSPARALAERAERGLAVKRRGRSKWNRPAKSNARSLRRSRPAQCSSRSRASPRPDAVLDEQRQHLARCCAPGRPRRS